MDKVGRSTQELPCCIRFLVKGKVKLIKTFLGLFFISCTLSCETGHGITNYHDPVFEISATIPAKALSESRIDSLKNGSVMKSVLYQNKITRCNFGIVSIRTPRFIGNETLERYAAGIFQNIKCSTSSKTDTLLNGIYAVKYISGTCPPDGHDSEMYFMANEQMIYTITVEYWNHNESIARFLSSIRVGRTE